MNLKRSISQCLCSGITVLAFAGLGLCNGNNSTPQITGVSPSSGSVSGGTSVTITGSNFSVGLSVIFSNVSAPTVTYVNSNTLLAVTPPHTAGTVSVIVVKSKNHGAQMTNAFTFAGSPPPTITGVSPNTGLVTGGAQVTISGSNFQSGATVTFGSNPASNVVVSGSGQIIASTPPEGAGTVSVSVQNPDGGSGTLPQAYAFDALPTVAGVTPNSGTVSGGTQVTITGTGFENGAAVTFGSTPASSVTVANSTQVTAVSPAGSVGTVGITVANPDGGTGSLAQAFTFNPNSLPQGCGANTDNSQCGNTGDPYEGHGAPPNQQPVSACGAALASNTNYKLTGNIGSDPTGLCLTIGYNQQNVNLDLGGYTVTGGIFDESTGNGNTIMNGTVTCDFDTSQYPQACVNSYVNGPTTAQLRIHHLTINQQNGGGIQLQIEQDSPVTYNGGGSGLGMACRVDHISWTSIPSISPNRYGMINSEGYCNVEEDDNYIHCQGNTLQACQGLGASVSNVTNPTEYAYLHNNEILMDAVSPVTQDGRAIMCDQGAGVGGGTCDVYNNYIVATNNRAIRYRNPASVGTQHGNVYGNEILNIQCSECGTSTSGRIGAIHLGEDDVDLENFNLQVYGNSFELNTSTGGNAVSVGAAQGVTIHDNSVSCYNSTCGAGGTNWVLLTDTWQYAAGVDFATIQNTTMPTAWGSTPAVEACGPPGAASYACTDDSGGAASVTYCNTGIVTGNGSMLESCQ